MRRLIPALVTLTAAAAVIIAFYSAADDKRSSSRAIDLRDVAGAENSAVEPHAGASKGNVSARFREELATLREHLARAPDDTALLIRTARLLDDAHQPDEAIIYYERYTEIDAGNREVWFDLANVYAALGRWDDALQASHSVLKISPQDAAAMYNIGAIYANMGRNKEARSWWEKVRDHPDESYAELAAASLERLPTRAR